MLKSIVLVLAMAAVAVQASSPAEVLTKEGLTSAVEIAKISGAAEALSVDASVTVLAPTNEAVDAFLKEMGITLDYLKKTEALADDILAYHLVMGVAAGPEQLFAESNTIIAPTAAYPYNLTFTKSDSGVTVTDFQGNVANIVKVNLGESKYQVHAIDRVLYSGAYWPSLQKLTSTMPGAFSTVAAAAEKAGISMTPKGATIFLPTNEAFEKAGITLDADKATIETVLKYHVVEGDRTIPTGFVSGQKVKTLEGQDITVEYEVSNNKVTETMVDATAYVIDAKGDKVTVIHPNLFVSDSEAHVINGVLMPKLEAASTATTTAASKPATTTTTTATTAASKPVATATTTASKPAATVSTPTKVTFTKPSLPVPSPATFTLKHPFLGKGVTFTVNFGGRKLMQGGGSGAGIFSQYASTAALDASSAAILNAVNSQASLGSTAGAGAVGVLAANAQNPVSRFPVSPLYAYNLSPAGYLNPIGRDSN